MAQAWTDSNIVLVLSEDEAYLVQTLLEDATPFLNETARIAAGEIVSEFDAWAPQLAVVAANDDTGIWGD